MGMQRTISRPMLDGMPLEALEAAVGGYRCCSG